MEPIPEPLHDTVSQPEQSFDLQTRLRLTRWTLEPVTSCHSLVSHLVTRTKEVEKIAECSNDMVSQLGEASRQGGSSKWAMAFVTRCHSQGGCVLMGGRQFEELDQSSHDTVSRSWG